MNTSALDCAVVKRWQDPVTVTIASHVTGQDGRAQGLQVLNPGEADQLTTENEQAVSAVGYCTFGVRGATRSVQASACITDEYDCQGIAPAC